MSAVRRGRVGSPEKRVGETQTAGPVQGAGLGRTTGQHEVIVTAMAPFLRWRNRGTGWQMDLSTELGRGSTEIQTQTTWLQSLGLHR